MKGKVDNEAAEQVLKTGHSDCCQAHDICLNTMYNCEATTWIISISLVVMSAPN